MEMGRKLVHRCNSGCQMHAVRHFSELCSHINILSSCSYHCRLQMYLVLGVVSLYQSNFEPLAQFDHRHLLPTPTGAGGLAGGAGKGSGNRGDRMNSGDVRTEVSQSESHQPGEPQNLSKHIYHQGKIQHGHPVRRK